MTYCRICQKKWVDRGFFYGPYCPIYGFGAIGAISIFSQFLDNWFLIFVLASIGATILEYIVSYILEKLFGATWWDYSHLPFNINGRVCILNSVEFGLLALVILYAVQPTIARLVVAIPIEYIHYIITALMVILAVDLMSTLNAILNLKERLRYLQDLGEKIRERAANTLQNSEMIKQLEDMKKEFIYRKDNLRNRFINAFPNMTFPKFNTSFEELKEAVARYNEARKQKKVTDEQIIEKIKEVPIPSKVEDTEKK